MLDLYVGAPPPVNLNKHNLFSRNGNISPDLLAGIGFCIVGCGSVGSAIALELARAGADTFWLIDSDVIKAHNIARHQCGIKDIGRLKVEAVAERIMDINPWAMVHYSTSFIQDINPDELKWLSDKSIVIGCGDNRYSDKIAASAARMFRAPFLSVGFWDNAAVLEIFIQQPEAGPCYACALGGIAQQSSRPSARHEFYLDELDEAETVFTPGLSMNITLGSMIAAKLALDLVLEDKVTPDILGRTGNYLLFSLTADPAKGGERVAAIFDSPLQLIRNMYAEEYGPDCPPCRFLGGS